MKAALVWHPVMDSRKRQVGRSSVILLSLGVDVESFALPIWPGTFHKIRDELGSRNRQLGVLDELATSTVPFYFSIISTYLLWGRMLHLETPSTKIKFFD